MISHSCGVYGMQEKLTFIEVSKVATQTVPNGEKLLIETTRGLPITREETCMCVNALESLRFE